jgi:hypothetical protein
LIAFVARPVRRRLALGKILWGAFVLPWRHRTAIARAAMPPLILVAACNFALRAADIDQRGPAQLTMYFVWSIATCWIAIAVHRVLLLGGADAGPRFNSAGLRRLGRFVAANVCIWAAFFVVMFAVLLMSGYPVKPETLVSRSSEPQSLLDFALAAAVFTILVLPVARLSPIFPAIAVDHSIDPFSAWSLSRGNGWKLAIVVGTLPLFMQWIVDAMSADGDSPMRFALLVLLTAVSTVIEAAALSLCYWELTRPEPPPTAPPA